MKSGKEVAIMAFKPMSDKVIKEESQSSKEIKDNVNNTDTTTQLNKKFLNNMKFSLFEDEIFG